MLSYDAMTSHAIENPSRKELAGKDIFKRGGPKRSAPAEEEDAGHTEVLDKLQSLHSAWAALPNTQGKNLAVAEWRQDQGLALVVLRRSKFLNAMGFMRGNEQWLHIEEALFLVETTRMLLMDGPTVLSLQEVAALLVGRGLRMEDYTAYSYLRRQGFIVRRRRAPWIVHKQGALAPLASMGAAPADPAPPGEITLRAGDGPKDARSQPPHFMCICSRCCSPEQPGGREDWRGGGEAVWQDPATTSSDAEVQQWAPKRQRCRAGGGRIATQPGVDEAGPSGTLPGPARGWWPTPAPLTLLWQARISANARARAGQAADHGAGTAGISFDGIECDRTHVPPEFPMLSSSGPAPAMPSCGSATWAGSVGAGEAPDVAARYDVYLPNKVFARRTPDKVHFQLCVSSGRPPTLRELRKLEGDAGGEVPVKYCQVADGTVMIFEINVVAI